MQRKVQLFLLSVTLGVSHACFFFAVADSPPARRRARRRRRRFQRR
jgi:hypothetical protein